MKKFVLFATVAALSLLTACYDNDGDYNMDWQDVNRVESIIGTHFIDPDEFVKTITPVSSIENSLLQTIRPAFDPLLGQLINKQKAALDELFGQEVGTGEDGGRKWQLEQWVFTYRSRSAKGEEILLSGRVIFPNNTVDGVGHQLKSLTLHSHGANQEVSRDWTSRTTLIDPRTFFNSAIISPDFQANGVNLGVDACEMVTSRAQAIQLADCALAAMQLMRQRGVTLADDGYTMNKGISKSAAVSIAFAKFYETEAPQWFRDLLKLKVTVSLEGPQDFADLFNYYDANPEFNATLGKSVVSSLASLNSKQLGGYEPGQFMADMFHNTIVTCLGEQMSYYDALSLYDYNTLDTEKAAPQVRRLSEMLASDMLTSDGHLDSQSPKTRAFLRILREQNNIYGWKPALPIYIIHNPQDDSIPYASSFNCYDILSSQGSNPNVHMGDFELSRVGEALLGRIPGSIHGVTCFLLDNIYLNLYESVEELPVKWVK